MTTHPDNQADQAENSYEDDHMIARIAPAVAKTRAKETILTITLETRLQDLNGSLKVDGGDTISPKVKIPLSPRQASSPTKTDNNKKT